MAVLSDEERRADLIAKARLFPSNERLLPLIVELERSEADRVKYQEQLDQVKHLPRYAPDARGFHKMHPGGKCILAASVDAVFKEEPEAKVIVETH